MDQSSITAPAAELTERIDTIEETYEFLLAYAAQGLADERAGASGAQARTFLERADSALAGLPDLVRALVAQKGLHPADRYHAFIDVLERDARDARAAVGLVLAQPSISSQLVDNLNASIHVRALLTDLFLIDEILKAHVTDTSALERLG